MNFYFTSGTFDFLKKVKERHPSENMLLMGAEEKAALLHETNGNTVFSQPRKYEVIESIGTLLPAGYAVLNHIPVTDEGRPLFEYRFKNRKGNIEKQPGFVAIRILRPVSSNPYVILTLWKNQSAFSKWKVSESFQSFHSQADGSTGGNPPTIFAGPSYITTYSIAEEE